MGPSGRQKPPECPAFPLQLHPPVPLTFLAPERRRSNFGLSCHGGKLRCCLQTPSLLIPTPGAEQQWQRALSSLSTRPRIGGQRLLSSHRCCPAAVPSSHAGGDWGTPQQGTTASRTTALFLFLLCYACKKHFSTAKKPRGSRVVLPSTPSLFSFPCLHFQPFSGFLPAPLTSPSPSLPSPSLFPTDG